MRRWKQYWADQTGDPVELPVEETGRLGGQGDEQATAPGADSVDGEVTIEASRLESIIESLLFTSDKALGLADLKRLLGERDAKKISAAVQTLVERRKGTGIEVAILSSGWHLRTNPENANWVSKLLVGLALASVAGDAGNAGHRCLPPAGHPS